MPDAPNAEPVDHLFAAPGQPMPGDYMDESSYDAPRDMQIVQDMRRDQATQYDRDNAIGSQHTDPWENPAQQVGPYAQSRIGKQVVGFRKSQAQQGVTLGVVASRNKESLAGASVYYNGNGKVLHGSVLAVGDQEFAVLWNDRMASVERKADYELVLKDEKN